MNHVTVATITMMFGITMVAATFFKIPVKIMRVFFSVILAGVQGNSFMKDIFPDMDKFTKFGMVLIGVMFLIVGVISLFI